MENTEGKKSKTIGEHLRPLRPLSFLRELLVVILGILITFGINAWIVRSSRQETIKGTMQTLVTELERNRDLISGTSKNFETDKRVFAMVEECYTKHLNLSEIPADTLEKYRNIAVSVRVIHPNDNALAVLQNSNLIPFMNKPELIADLFECYSMIRKVQEATEFYASQKSEIIQKLVGGMDSFGLLGKENAPEYWEWLLNDKAYRNLLFFTTPTIIEDIKDVSKHTVSMIDELVARISKEYRLAN